MSTPEAAPKRVFVPTNYRKAAKYLRLAVDERKDVKAVLAEDNHFRLGRTVLGRLLEHLPEINAVYARTELATREPRLNVWLARVLISEVLFGSGKLISNAGPVESIRRHVDELREALEAIRANTKDNPPFEAVMGRRKKPTRGVNEPDAVPNVEPVGNPAHPEPDDPYTIPLHSRQAAFAMLWLLVYSFAMFTLPFGAFYGARHLLTEHFQMDAFSVTCGSVLSAVITVNVIIMLYAFRGFRETEEEDRERRKS